MNRHHPQLSSQHSEPGGSAGGQLMMRTHTTTRGPIEHNFPIGCEPHSVFYTPPPAVAIAASSSSLSPAWFPKSLHTTHQQPIGGGGWATTMMMLSSSPTVPPSPISPNVFFKFPPAHVHRSDSNRSILARVLMNNSAELSPAAPPHRRSSLAIQPTSDVLNATPGSGLEYPANLKKSNASAFYHPSSCNSPASTSPSGFVAPSKNRKKAVIIVDAMSTEILISSESVRCLFALKDRSLIGKKLADVFPHVEPTTSPFISSSSPGPRSPFRAGDGKKGPAIVGKDSLFSVETHRLKAIYGKPVDIVSSDGKISTVSVWSYPLTTTAALIVRQRKKSAIASSPSPPPPTAVESECRGAIGTDDRVRDSTTTRTLNSDCLKPPHRSPCAARSNKGSSSAAFSAANFCLTDPPPQRSKSTCAAYSPYLRVLQEESLQKSPDPSRRPLLLNSRQISSISSPTSSVVALDDASGPSETHRHFLPHLPPVHHLQLHTEELQQKESIDGKGENMGRGGSGAGVGGNDRKSNTSSQCPTSTPTSTDDDDVDDGGAAVMSSGDDEAKEGTPVAPCPEGTACSPSECFMKAGAPTRHGGGNNGVSWMNGAEAGDAGGIATSDEGAANRRWLITMEPINALHIEMTLGAKGRIFRTDDSLASVLGYDCASLLFGSEIRGLIPSLQVGIEWDGVEQLCCGITKKRNGVPFSVVLKGEHSEKDNAVASSYSVQVRSLSSINGVVTITDSGALYSFNENFLHELCGQNFHGHRSDYDITELIPEFYSHMSEKHLVPGQQQQTTSTGTIVSESSTHPRACSATSSASSADSYATARGNMGEFEHDAATNCSQVQQNGEDGTALMERLKLVHPNEHEIVPGVFFGLVRHIDGSKIPVRMEVSSLDMQSQPHLFAVCIGFDRSDDYGISQQVGVEGEGSRHASTSQMNGSSEATFCTVKLGRGLPKQTAVAAHLASSMTTGGLLCASSDAARQNSDQQFTSSAPMAKFSIGGSGGFGMLRECDSDSAVDSLSCSTPVDAHTSQHTAEQQQPSTSMMSNRWMELGQCSVGAGGARLGDCGRLGEVDRVDTNNEALRGDYSKYYDTFQVLGNGAFGSVMLAARKDSGLLAAAKFINKDKVLPESWVPSPKRGNRMVPIEVHLLENLQHQNIVRVLDVFENECYYQLVMEKLGYGIDLFEFIDHRPKMDEPLISYIFRQIISAVDYLHENHIVHRDLKDENVIIDQEFRCKLIDFGSAAFFGDQIVFSTFCGTMEYCSPEVLTGNKYRGPELEMWSCGILLYTLVYFENPFTHPQETIRGAFAVQWEISEGLYQVLSWLLQPNPQLRATVGEIKRHWWVIQKIDMRAYKFHELMRKCDLAQVTPPLYVSDLQNQLKNNASCGNLAVSAMHNGTANAVTGTRSNQPSRDHHSPNSGGGYLGLAT